ncbi:MAG: UDP-N-acetylmuramate--L-alanine ligase [Zetaproteobacteria bacterium]|nr:MAG: UDP-N-acetylmuramate--L-alanine ligase [Zetaproteobacteria bacterium]
MKGRVRTVHFVGIGGIGMSGIAEVLHNLGFRVQGSDLSENANVQRLRSLGVPVWIGHAPEHVQGADVVVYTSAASDDNPELEAARAAGIPVIPRAEMLAELMRMRHGIAVAGSHGKTTVTSMIAHAMEAEGLDPTYVIGGRLIATGQNARLGASEWIVVEADESDGSFLKLSPTIAVITNIDPEHLDTYGSLDALVDAFVQFANAVPFYGRVILHHTHPQVVRVRARTHRPVWSYGASPQADVALRTRTPQGLRQTLSVAFQGRPAGTLALSVPGMHNAENALAALAVLLELGLSFTEAARALAGFPGIHRRLQHAQIGSGMLVDDYAHHPREIEAVLATLREAFGTRPITVVFQPHRYTRTKLLFSAFITAFDLADRVVVAPIYPASEKPIPGITHEALVEAMHQQGRRHAVAVPDLDAAQAEAERALARGEVVLVAGAGSIAKVAARIREGA